MEKGFNKYLRMLRIGKSRDCTGNISPDHFICEYTAGAPGYK